MLSWKVAEITDLLLTCGNIALQYYHNPEKYLKSDLSIVTQADKEIENYIIQNCEDLEQGSFVIGEESIEDKGSSSLEEAYSRTAWIIDPIDGTASYAHQIPVWGISLGFMQGGILCEGAVYLPVTRELFISRGSEVYYWVFSSSNAEKLEISREQLHRQISVESGLVAVTQLIGKKEVIDITNPIHCLCCAVVPLTYLCMGRYLAYIGSLQLWDFAGSLPILEKCGLKARLASGAPLTCDNVLPHLNRDLRGAAACRMKERIIFAGSDEIIDLVSGKLL